MLGQFRAGPDAGELQDLRRADGAGGQHHLAARPRDPGDAVLAIGDADSAAILDQHALGEAAGLQPQIWPAEHRLQEAPRRAPAEAALLVHLEIGGAGVVAGVEVRDRGDAVFLRGAAHRVEQLPGQARELHAPFAARTVEFAGAEIMVLSGS